MRAEGSKIAVGRVRSAAVKFVSLDKVKVAPVTDVASGPNWVTA